MHDLGKTDDGMTVRRVCESLSVNVSASFAESLEEGISREIKAKVKGMPINRRIAPALYLCREKLIVDLALKFLSAERAEFARHEMRLSLINSSARPGLESSFRM